MIFSLVKIDYFPNLDQNNKIVEVKFIESPVKNEKKQTVVKKEIKKKNKKKEKQKNRKT